MSTSRTCINCRKPDTAETDCGVCGEGVCRKCRLFLAEDAFSFWGSPLEPELRHKYYCSGCFGAHIEPFKERYDELMYTAKQVNVFYKESASVFRILRKAKRPLEVTAVTDRDEAVMRMAFLAALEGFNSLVDVEVSSKKIRNEGYQTLSWSGRGLPAEIKSKKIEDFG